MVRPQFLFPLFGSLENLKGIGTKTVLNLKKIGVSKPLDFLYSFPTNLKLTTHLFSFCDLNIHKVFNHQMSIFVNKACPLDRKTFSLLCLVKYTRWIGCIVTTGYCSFAV